MHAYQTRSWFDDYLITKGNKTMAKIARTPYNGARYITQQVSKDTTLNSRMTGRAIFVDVQEEVNINIQYLSNGDYFRIILKSNSTAILNLNFNSVSGIVFADDGSSTAAISYDDSTLVQIAAGSAAGSFMDIVCDGSKWYLHGLTAAE